MAMRFGGGNAAPMRGMTGHNNNNNAHHFGSVPPGSTTNTTSSSADEEAKKPTMYEVIAMALCYRRLALVLGAAPLLVAVTPFLVKTALWMVNCVTKGYGNTSLVLTAVLTWTWYSSLKSAAPTPEKLQEAYQKSQVRLPLFLFVGSCCLLRGLAGITAARPNNSGDVPWMMTTTPTMAWGVGLWPAFGLSLVGLTILLRFVGPSSFVRCSTVPLVSTNRALHALQSKESFLSFLASPNDNVASLQFPDFRSNGRRCQSPSFLSGVANLVVIIIMGYWVAESVFVPYWQAWFESSSSSAGGGSQQSYETMKRSYLLIRFTCVLTMIMHFGLGGTTHELNPKQYYTNVTNRQQRNGMADGPQAVPVLISGGAFMTIVSRTVGCAIVAPLFALVSISMVFGDGQLPGLMASVLDTALVAVMFFCLGASALVGFYSAVLDEASRTVLCTPGMNLERCVRDANVGRAPGGGTESTLTEVEVEEYVVDAMLHSILHGDSELVTDIWQSTASKTQNCVDLERYEVARNSNAIDRMAKVLLGNKEPKRSVGRPERPLEEDILRHSILESMGGSVSARKESNMGVEICSAIAVAAKSIQEYPPSQRHIETIRVWVLSSSSSSRKPIIMSGQGAHEPKGVVLVRALCAYTGGVGQALTDASKSRSSYIDWLLPPAAVAASEYAVIALARCLVTHLQHVKHDWRSSHLSMLIAAALSSAYRLHTGTLDYALYRKNRNSMHFHQRGAIVPKSANANGSAGAMDYDIIRQQLVKDHPELHQLLRAIDEAVRAILAQLEETAGNASCLQSVTNALERNCSQWIRVRHGRAI